ncbi:hypothetical protein EEB19_05055 [Gordonia sp. OPL2]|nr:hypothetical protein EEB19_05055 [Gordonia sp. OPL2]
MLDTLPGPLLRVLVPRLLAVGDDTHDDPRYTAGYRAALHEAVSPQPGTMNAWPTRTGHRR